MKMKRYIQYLLPLLLSVLLPEAKALAEIVPADKAKAKAIRFLQQADPSRRPNLSLTEFPHPQGTKSAVEAPAFYVFNDAKGGFVIAGGDDTIPDVIGYSTTERLDLTQIPENMLSWLDMWQQIVTANRASSVPEYQAPPRTTGRPAKLLTTALWDQDDPFNLLCPEFDGDRCITGCTSTATSIVMRYHKYPNAGTGKLMGYTYTKDGVTRMVSGVDLGHTYVWDKMPLDNPDSWTDEQKTQVATLLRDVGIMLKSQYGKNETGAHVSDIAEGLSTYFGYDKAARHDYKKYYSNAAAWTARIEQEIDEVGPVVYSGYTTQNDGHAFVIDGYDGQGYLHINWGWGGSKNNYFIVPEFQEYTKDHSAVFGLRPDAGGKTRYELAMLPAGGAGLSLREGSLEQGSEFVVSCSGVYNMSKTPFTGNLAYAKFNGNDEIEEIVSASKEVTIGAPTETGYRGIAVDDMRCKFTTAVKKGDYISMAFTTSGSSDWAPVHFDHEDDSFVGALQLYDDVVLETIVSLRYSVNTGVLTASFTDSCTRELRNAAGSVVTSGVQDDGDKMTIDANSLVKGTYTLHLERGDQSKDIQIVFGLK